MDEIGTSPSSRDCTLTFIGTATMLLRLGPFTLLTDPNFLHRGERAHLGYGLTSKRRTEPAMQIPDLPPLDAVLLSHMHGDHWDRVARRDLDHTLRVITTPKAAKALLRQGFGAAEALETWSTTTLDAGDQQLSITSMPGRHATGVARFLLPPVMGSMLEYRPSADGIALRMYITGDTLFVDDLRPIPHRYPAVDVAVLHLGGTTLPGGLVVTMDARQGADLLELVRPHSAVPVHYDDYGVFKSPLSSFRAEVERRGLAEQVRYVERGQTLALLPS